MYIFKLSIRYYVNFLHTLTISSQVGALKHLKNYTSPAHVAYLHHLQILSIKTIYLDKSKKLFIPILSDLDICTYNKIVQTRQNNAGASYISFSNKSNLVRK